MSFSGFLVVLGVLTQYGVCSSQNEIFPERIRKDPTYFILASKTIRPGHLYSLSVTILKTSSPITVRASIQRDGVELASMSQVCREKVPQTLTLKVPPTSVLGVYKLRVEGDIPGILGGNAFFNETYLQFSQRSMTIFIQTDKPIYMQGDLVRFRAIPVTTDLKAFSDAVDVFMLDPRGTIMRRWLSRQTNIGAVSLNYQLSLQPLFGNWTIQIVALGQVEEKTFFVEEYYQTPFEVNVTMPAYILENEQFVTGSVTANYTSGVPVMGNLSITAFVESLQSQYKSFGRPPEMKHFVHFFHGHAEFKFPMNDLRKIISHLDNTKVTVIVEVGDPFLNRIESGFAESIIFDSNLKLDFLGTSPQVFKPAMPFKSYVAISYHDGSPLPAWRLNDQKLELNTVVNFKGGGKRTLDTRLEQMSPIQFGIWEITTDLISQIEPLSLLNDVYSIVLEAKYVDDTGERAKAALLAYASHTPTNNHIQVATSTRDPKVGEYIIFHVRTDYYVELFSYTIISKGIILLSSVEEMSASIKTFAVTLSADMAPTATIVVYTIAREGEVIVDSLTFPVDGITRNNFSVTLNNRKDMSGETVEVIIQGRPGTFVGLSAIDKTTFNMRTGNDMSHSEILEKMNAFQEEVNNTHSFIWRSRETTPSQFVHFPSGTYALDASGIFEFCSLVVFSDATIPRLKDGCNHSIGYISCMDGSCYRKEKRCDGYADCSDGSDENSFFCRRRRRSIRKEAINRADFQRTRRNRILNTYRSSWLWKDLNIGPLGYYIFNVPVPSVSTTWVVDAFGMNSIHGFGLLSAPLEFSSIRPFYIVVEMPARCLFGEQLSIRISIFNYYHVEIEALVVLAKSPDYKFVHAESLGNVGSYDPPTSEGEQQHLVFIKAGKSAIVYMPIVATRIGTINVTVMAKSVLAKDLVTKTLTVEASGIPQYRHTSVVLDLTRGAYLIKYMDTNLTESPVLSHRRDRLYVFGSNKASISVTGDVVGATFPTMPINATSLLRKPSWCGEQNMFDFASNLYTLLYLRLSGQREQNIEKKAFHFLNIGYQRQLSYQNKDGSFSLFRWETPSSVWLTAFCSRVFHKAMFQEWENFFYIDSSVVTKAVDWILRHQSPVGAFYETTSYPFDRKMNLTSDRPNDHIRYRNISLTAHVLITLAEVGDLRGDLGIRIVRGRQAAQHYLEKMLHIIKDFKDPYEIAIVAYALTLVNSMEGEAAFNILDSKMRDTGGMRYWAKIPVSSTKVKIENNRPHLLPRLPQKYEASNVETTAYALLVHVNRQAVIQKEIVEWLNIQRSTDGGWASTQDTIIAMQALIEYSLQSQGRDATEVTIMVEVPSTPGFSKQFQIDDRNLLNLQKTDIPNAWGPIIIKAQGTGLALVQLSVQYNVDWKHLITPPPMSAFNLDVNVYFYGRNNSHVLMESCQSWRLQSESQHSGMAILEIGTPTGYVVPQRELHEYVFSNSARNLREARFTEGKVIFYFQYLDISPICVSFTLQRWYPVANVTQFLPVKVYDYYAPEMFNETMLDMYNLNVLNVCQVCGSFQCPYCPLFNDAISPKISVFLLILTSVLSGRPYLFSLKL